LVTREDSDAIFAYLRSLPAVEQPPRRHELEFPYNTQLALAVWRALYFKPATFEVQASQSTTYNRGAYLVQGLGHCAACHASRNAMGASAGNGVMDGSVVATQNWYAPPLGPVNGDKSGDKATYAQSTFALLKNGITPHSSAKGLMAEVVSTSTQHLGEDDLKAIAEYLSKLPATPVSAPVVSEPNPDTMKLGADIYNKHCADCHGKQGQGVPNIYPVLAGNPHVTQPDTTNLLQIVKGGGFAPSTAANPRPYGMPPFAQTLKDDELAAVITYVRNSWGNRGSSVTLRGLP
jgi:mono/diheme cytochrome c family protein